MLDCLILGDSIGVGVSQHRPDCVAYATVGINSRNFVNKHITTSLAADTIVISLGANDHKNIQTLKELFTLRQVVRAKHIYWIVPVNNKDAAASVETVADKFQDNIVYIKDVSGDKVHPTSKEYKRLANVTK